MSQKRIIKDTVKNLHLREYPYTKEWTEKFNKLPVGRKEDVIEYMNRTQALYVKDMMGEMVNDISLQGFGKFYYKKSRVDFYEFRKRYPDMSIPEVIEMVKEKHLDRLKRKKGLKKISKNKTIMLQK